MGARISAFAAIDRPEKVRSVIFGGMGINLIHGMGDSREIIAGLRAENLSDITHKTARQFRIFAEHTASDLQALAACLTSSRAPITQENIENIDIPALVAVGSEDGIGGSPELLADILPQGEALLIKGRDHMRATGDKQFKDGVLSFLEKNC